MTGESALSSQAKRILLLRHRRTWLPPHLLPKSKRSRIFPKLPVVSPKIRAWLLTQLPNDDAAAAASLSWSSFDPLEFIERGVTMVDDMTRFTNTSTEDLRKKALEY
ncbi:hypothetical protein L195_g060472, partial [Trifolium pratense]